MNRIEALVDRVHPGVAVRLRWVKKRWRRDIGLRIIRTLVRPGDVVVDIGANRGVYTYALATAVGPSGRVHSFDPVPVNVRSLERLRRTRANVVVHPMALSDRTGTADLHVPVLGATAVDGLARLGAEPPAPHRTEVVDIGTLDDALDGEAPLSFVKCDVEGHEQHVLEGGRQVLTRSRPALFVEIEQRHRLDDVRATIDELLALGYEGYGVTSDAVVPIEAFDVERDQVRLLDRWPHVDRMPPGYIGNFLFVPPGTDLGPLGVG